MHSDIHDQSARGENVNESRSDEAHEDCPEDDVCGMMAEPDETTGEDACCCC